MDARSSCCPYVFDYPSNFEISDTISLITRQSLRQLQKFNCDTIILLFSQFGFKIITAVILSVTRRIDFFVPIVELQGTNIAAGKCRGIVIGTGLNTEIGNLII
jgi:hypothetical protein